MNDSLASGLCYGHTVSGLGLSLSSNYVQYHYTITRRGEFLYRYCTEACAIRVRHQFETLSN
jgi:hypothetical protein